RIAVGGTATPGSDHDLPGEITATITAGATSAPVILAAAADPFDGGDETVVLTIVGSAGALVADGSVVATIVDEEPLAAMASAGTAGAQAIPPAGIDLAVGPGGLVTVVVRDGRRPFSVSASAGVLYFTGQPGIGDEDGDGDAEPVQTIVLTPRAVLSSEPVIIADGQGASLLVRLTTPGGLGLAPVPLPAPALPRSTAGTTIYGALCPGTADGLARLRAALAGRAASEVRAFTWDAVQQAYREQPAEPTGGLLATHGWFVASRIPLSVPFDGNPAPFFSELVLQPGLNFVGLPPVGDGGPVETDHPWASLGLFDGAGNLVSGPARTAAIGSGAYLWDGEGYSLVTTLQAGTGYWFKNFSGQPLVLVRFPPGFDPAVLSGGNASAVQMLRQHVATGRETVRLASVPVSDPPAPPGQTATPPAASGGGSGGGGCGLGSGLAVLLLGLGLALRRRRMQP
ncbi:MAG: hypothetical protein RLZZ127_2980, partial [Planctomycetota bacterium]